MAGRQTCEWLALSWTVGVLTHCAAPPDSPPVNVVATPVVSLSPPTAYSAATVRELSEPPPKLDCHLSEESWSAVRDVSLRVGAARRPFVRVLRGRADLLVRSQREIRLTVTAGGFVLRGALEPAELPLYPARPRLLHGMMVLAPRAELDWQVRHSHIAASHTADVRPHERVGASADPPGELRSPVVAWVCDDLALASGSFDPWEALELSDRRWFEVAAGTEVQLRPPEDSLAAARLRLGSGIHVRSLEQADGQTRVAWREQTALLVGWVESSAVQRAGGRFGRAHRARPPRVRLSGHLPHRMTCDQRVALWVGLGGDHRVGHLEPGTEVACSVPIAGKITLEPPQHVRMVDVDLFVKSQDVGRHCTVR